MTLKKQPETLQSLSGRKTLRVPEPPALKRKLPTLADVEERKPTLARRSPLRANEGGLVRKNPGLVVPPSDPHHEEAPPEPPRLAGTSARRGLGEGGRAKTNKLAGAIRALRQKKTK